MPSTEATSHKDACEKSATPFPPEIRVKIYEELLINLNRPLYPNAYAKGRRGRKCVFTSILRVCRTFYEEALPILYGRNILAFRDTGLLKPWLPFPKGHLAMVKHVRVNVSPAHYGSVGKMGDFLIDLHLSGAKLIDLSIRIYGPGSEDDSESQLPDGFLVHDHPIVVGLFTLKAVKKLKIDFEGEVRFEAGVADALRESFLKEQSTVGQSITIRKICSVEHPWLDPGEPCSECGKTKESMRNGIAYLEYQDDEITRQLTEQFNNYKRNEAV